MTRANSYQALIMSESRCKIPTLNINIHESLLKYYCWSHFGSEEAETHNIKVLVGTYTHLTLRFLLSTTGVLWCRKSVQPVLDPNPFNSVQDSVYNGEPEIKVIWQH